MRFAGILGIVLGLSVLPVVASAEPRHRYYYSYYRPYYPRHDGLFFRLAAGLGGTTADDHVYDVGLSGGSGFFSLDLGGAVAPGLALHGRLSIDSMFEPSITSGGQDLGRLEDTSLSFTLLGLGLTYYLPSNFYFTGVVGLSHASFQYFGDEYDSLNGIGFQGDFGYEWPLGGDWGLGIGARLELNAVRGDDERLSTAGLGLLVTLSHF
jgi:hypothetical protein